MPLQAQSSDIYWQTDEAADQDATAALLEQLESQDALRDGAGRTYTNAAAPSNTATRFPTVRNDAGSSSMLATPRVNKRDADGRSVSFGTVETSTIANALVKTSRDLQNTFPEHADDEDEYTFNPDRELEEAQAEQHEAYEGQQFYGAIKFGEFGKYMQNKRRKLSVQQGATRRNADEEQTSNLLRGLKIYINGETEPPAHVLSNMIVLHGGVYTPYLDQKTIATHIIASRLTPSKRIQFKDYKVVTAAWLLDSIRDQKIKDWRAYREDGSVMRSTDAFPGTQIAQPKLSFGATASKAIINKINDTKNASDNHASPKRSSVLTTPVKQSPKRLPPPTSDPISLIHVEGNAAAEAVGRQPDYITENWYPSKSNAKAAELMRDEQWRLNETAVNTTEFLEKYYRESRLHWLSTWKAELKKMVGELSEGREIDIGDGRKKKQLLHGDERDGRVIMHVDFDSFFVAASLLARPHLKGQPVVVCHSNAEDVGSSSEIASASYEAREFGIKNGMSLGSARSRCPGLHTVPYDFELYRSISSKFYTILFSHANELEAVSIDEAYISLPQITPQRTGKQLLEYAESIRAEILSATGCQTSIGVSHNKLLARLATNRAKPSSAFQIGNGTDATHKDIDDFLRDIDIETLPQIGWKRAGDVETKLQELNRRLKTGHFAQKPDGRAVDGPETEVGFDRVGHLRHFKLNQLKEALGEKTGEMLYYYARGVDSRELETENVRKSVSAEVNYGIRFKSDKEVETFMIGLGKEVAVRLTNLEFKGRQLTLKVMRRSTTAPIEPPKFMGHGTCDTFNASKTVELTNEAAYIGRTAWDLMRSLKIPPQELRGIGLQMQKLESALAVGAAAPTDGQSRLVFQAAAKDKDKQASMADVIADKGTAAVPLDTHETSILIEDSSSPEVSKQQLVEHTRTLRAKKDVKYNDVASDEDDLRVLSQMPAGFIVKPKNAQAIFGGAQIVKRAKSTSVPPKPIIIPATSPVVSVVNQAPTVVVKSPTRLTDKQLSLLGLDVNFFRSCGRDTQSQVLQEVLARRTDDDSVREMLVVAARVKKGKKQKSTLAPVFEEAAANVAKREEAKKRQREKQERAIRGPTLLKLGLFRHDDVNKKKKERGPPTFAGQSGAKEIRQLLSAWMDGVGIDHGPALEEVGDFATFCVRTASRDPAKNGSNGADVEKVTSLLAWWGYLIEQREKSAVKKGSQMHAVRAWRDALDDVYGRVNGVVTADWGAPLAVLMCEGAQ